MLLHAVNLQAPKLFSMRAKEEGREGWMEKETVGFRPRMRRKMEG